MIDASLCWRVEEACRQAWPADEESERGDWRLRFNHGLSRRANSANPIRVTQGDISGVIDWGEAEFAARGQRSIFRVPGLVDEGIDRQLAARGYAIEAESSTLHAELFPMPMRRDPDVVIRDRPDDAWVKAMGLLQQWDAARLARYRATIGRITVPAGFMALSIGGGIAAMAYGAIHDDIVCLESVVTDPARRRQGHGQRLLGALLAWAIDRRARDACLQVEAGNAPALALYRGMGFIRDLYPYHYRVKAAG
jgi:ribosomal protein S18 acetylase RimI-like enzyme